MRVKGYMDGEDDTLILATVTFEDGALAAVVHDDPDDATGSPSDEPADRVRALVETGRPVGRVGFFEGEAFLSEDRPDLSRETLIAAFREVVEVDP